MLNVSVARRYARALIDVAAESSRLEPVGEQLRTLAGIVQKNAELGTVLQDPAYTREQRMNVITQVMAAAQVNDPAVVNLVKLLVERNRMPYLPDLARAYQAFADARAGRVRGQLVSAKPLAEDAVSRIERALEKLTQRNVVLESRVDAHLLGGVSTQVGSVVYDGSLRNQLDELRRELTRG